MLGALFISVFFENLHKQLYDSAGYARLIESYKAHQRERLARLCRESGFIEPEQIADEIFLLFEGACVNKQSVGRGGPSIRFPEMICALLKSRARNTAAH